MVCVIPPHSPQNTLCGDKHAHQSALEHCNDYILFVAHFTSFTAEWEVDPPPHILQQLINGLFGPEWLVCVYI